MTGPRISFTSRFSVTQAGGIESTLRDLVPRVARERPAWRIRCEHAFAGPTRLNRIPFAGDVVAGAILAWKTRGDDVVLVNGAEYAWLRMCFPRLRRRTIVVWHGTRAGEVPALVPRLSVAVRVYLALEIALQRLALFAPAQIAVSPSAADEIVGTYGAGRTIETILNGAPEALLDAPGTPRPAQNDASVRILWVGTNRYKKGLDLAVAACRIARERGFDLRLRVAGVAATPADDEFVDALGTVPHEVLRDELAAAHVFLASTRYEACSIAVLEAMASTVPIVASPVVAWMLPASDAIAPRCDGAAFGAALVATLTDLDSARARARIARSKLARFDWNDAAMRYVATIERTHLPSTAP